ncbi:threonine ammonia-lyase, biosynthetic [Caldimonas thermodepolymerans]|uniref:L-threonine dehydratase n=1 Tax=Caldimonas thermodepolymerans TaxID=215580 RepID=A0A2S5T611_9BURK|nr:threonine ammonia-lyase, biosynthetic [Caldimonas thermodepolymerans]PPE70445.1 threonine ammonia-lyase, biosynthetic [Caldimonas thermodepolymerans]QPC31112.1 threonine ammonia-lyase, biosynthetic [Caldimonas thermodepolymerans]RDH96563.1 L-threonine ammonia-lyase [Caldimonas thermodepolymerans]TCP04838.1 L-threonine ammonia-lyase [Caldimonas thermodepolymerans]UZG47504.1 threonine ammonia-lyase, biosynthetic [Caldimonas thermodepolymerans]
MARAARKPSSAPAPKRQLKLADYLQKILTAKVYDVAIETELELARDLTRRLGNEVWLKREDNQPVFSFKLRGAYNKMAHLSPAQLKRGVICASAGNHAQGVALSASRMGCRAVIVMPETTPQVKVDAVRSLGGEVVLHGDSYSDAYLHALELEKKHGLTFVHPFDDPDVIAGQGTIAMEILRQHQGPIDAIFVAIGGGGLISGVAAYVKAVRPEIKVIGVQMTDSDAMVRSVQSKRRVQLHDVGLFADGTAVKLVGEETFRLARELVDDYVVVDTDAVCAAIKDVFQDTRSILEPSGAMGVAAIKQYVERHRCKGKTFVAVTCGANMNFDRLRFVAERAEVGEEREALFAVTIPEERGSFRRLCSLLGKRSVTEFNYRISDDKVAHVFVGLTTSNRGESSKIAAMFQKHGFPTLDLTRDELAKEHIRHMVGGRSTLAQDERLFRFTFPERPGALMRFLSCMHPEWNISLFHYRNQGADYGRILVGLQVPKSDKKAFREFLDTLAYPYVEETGNPVYQLFLR